MIDVSASGHYVGDCRELLARLPEGCVQTCVTSPPYWGLRDYGCDEQIGLEPTPELYVAALVEVFRGVRRALREDGTLWLNLGDSYATFAGRVGAAPGGGKQGAKWRGDGMPKVNGRGEPMRTRAERDPKHAGKHTAIGPMTQPNRMPIDGLKPKDLVGIPWLVAFALRADGWYLRQDIIWSKPNPMPESVTDRCTKAHEYLFLLSKSKRYQYDAVAIAEPYTAGTIARMSRPEEQANNNRRVALGNHQGTLNVNGGLDPNSKRNRRSVWTVAAQPYDGAHFATFPPKLIEPCILASSRPGDLVLDPFFGSGTTGAVAEKHGRRWIGFDLNPEYAELAKRRTAQRSLVLGDP